MCVWCIYYIYIYIYVYESYINHTWIPFLSTPKAFSPTHPPSICGPRNVAVPGSGSKPIDHHKASRKQRMDCGVVVVAIHPTCAATASGTCSDHNGCDQLWGSVAPMAPRQSSDALPLLPPTAFSTRSQSDLRVNWANALPLREGLDFKQIVRSVKLHQLSCTNNVLVFSGRCPSCVWTSIHSI